MNTDNANRFSHSPRRVRFAICVLIFLLAFGVRVLSWHDTRLEVGKVQSGVTADYQRIARLLQEGGISSFFSSSSPLADLNNLGHPPGYSIVIALVHSVFGNSTTAIQFVQITGDALAAVIIFLIVAELLSTNAAAIAGILAAFSPQFAWNSVLLLPDSLAVLPILLAVYCLVLAIRNPRLYLFVIAGMLVGISCWLRANAMLLTFFIAAVPLLMFRRRKAWPYALAVVIATMLTILPLTIRNAIVFHRFIPLSLGAGQTLLEGITDYDPEGRFGIPKTDMGIMKQEAETFHRPDYYGTLFNPDGIEREQARLVRGFAIIKSHPLWFAGVMVQRGASMLRLERSRLISTEPPVSHSLDVADKLPATWSKTPAELFTAGEVLSPRAGASLMENAQWLAVTGDESNYGEQFSSPKETVNKNTDYLFRVPIKIEQGRMKLSVKGSKGRVYASAIVETLETVSPNDQPVQQVQLPFVESESEQVRIVLSNEASNPPKPFARIGTIKLFELGPARFLWTLYPRLLLHGIQKLFLTAVMLPLTIMGLVLLFARKHWGAFAILLVVPIYYLCVQSIVHTEYRYVLAVDYFLFAFVAITVEQTTILVMQKVGSFRRASSRSNH